MVTREAILAALRAARPTELVTIAGVELRVRSMNGDERQILLERAKAGNPLLPKELVAMCVCDEAGAPVFSPGDLAELGGLDADQLEQLVRVIVRISKLNPEAEAEAVKN